jgi:hypothetical protein
VEGEKMAAVAAVMMVVCECACPNPSRRDCVSGVSSKERKFRLEVMAIPFGRKPCYCYCELNVRMLKSGYYVLSNLTRCLVARRSLPCHLVGR